MGFRILNVKKQKNKSELRKLIIVDNVAVMIKSSVYRTLNFNL